LNSPEQKGDTFWIQIHQLEAVSEEKLDDLGRGCLLQEPAFKAGIYSHIFEAVEDPGRSAQDFRLGAAAMMAFVPPPETIAKGRDFAARTALTPRQHSSGGKERLGRTSKMGQRDLRRLLITGAMAVVRWATPRGAPEGSWLWRMLQRKPRMLVAVALANRMARIAWALMAKGGVYKDPTVAA